MSLPSRKISFGRQKKLQIERQLGFSFLQTCHIGYLFHFSVSVRASWKFTMMVCDSGTRSNKVTSDSFYWGTCHWKMLFLAPEMQQVLAGILAAILWTYFQGGRMCFKKMKSDKIELLRSDWSISNEETRGHEAMKVKMTDNWNGTSTVITLL